MQAKTKIKQCARCGGEGCGTCWGTGRDQGPDANYNLSRTEDRRKRSACVIESGVLGALRVEVRLRRSFAGTRLIEVLVGDGFTATHRDLATAHRIAAALYEEATERATFAVCMTPGEARVWIEDTNHTPDQLIAHVGSMMDAVISVGVR